MMIKMSCPRKQDAENGIQGRRNAHHRHSLVMSSSRLCFDYNIVLGLTAAYEKFQRMPI